MYKAVKGNYYTYASPMRVKELYGEGYELYDETGRKLEKEEIELIKPETHTLIFGGISNEFRN